MKSKTDVGRSVLERYFPWGFCMAGAVAAGAVSRAGAAEILANAQLKGVSLGHGNYRYTLTLNNTSSSTASIKMFWFGWEAGQADFLYSEPTSIQTPSAWSATVLGGGQDDGYSVQFVTFTDALKPGSSLSFSFESTDSPSIMAGPAVFYTQYDTLTSQVYSNPAASGVQDVFVAQVIPSDLGKLAAKINGSNLVLTWSSGTNVVLQQSSTLSPANWATVSGTRGASSFAITNVSSSAPAFYRLATQ